MEVCHLSQHGRALTSQSTLAVLEARLQSIKASGYSCDPKLLLMIIAGLKNRQQCREPSNECDRGRNLLECEYGDVGCGSGLM